MDGTIEVGIEGPWYVQLSVLLGLVITLSTVLRLVIWPILKRFWQAIIAAPKLAENVGRLVELLEIDILHKVEVLEIKTELAEAHIGSLDSKVSAITARLDAHDKRADAYEMRTNLIESRISAIEIKVAKLEGFVVELSTAGD